MATQRQHINQYNRNQRSKFVVRSLGRSVLLLLVGGIAGWRLSLLSNDAELINNFAVVVAWNDTAAILHTSSEAARDDCSKNSSNVTETSLRHTISQNLVRQYESTLSDLNPVYFDLLEEAERRSREDFHKWHNLGHRGVVLGPTAGKFKYTVAGLKTARRIRNISPKELDIKLALITSVEHQKILGGCERSGLPDLLPGDKISLHDQKVACRLWANNTLFDHVLDNWDSPPKVNTDHAKDKNNQDPNYKMLSLAAGMMAPYKQSLILDTDALPCPGFEKIFSYGDLPRHNKYFTTSTRGRPVDLVIGLEQYPFPPGRWIIGGSQIQNEFKKFTNRNLGSHFWNFHSRLLHTFAHFVLLVSEHTYNTLTSSTNQIAGEQVPFRIATFVFKKLRTDFYEELFPLHTSCRSYPNFTRSGIDGAVNGMLPIQDNGTRMCNTCKCTPCLITHFLEGPGPVRVTAGRMGWEDNTFIRGAGNGYQSFPWHNATVKVPP